MKKVLALMFALIGIYTAVNAQPGECKIESVPGGYIHATHKLQLSPYGGNESSVTIYITAYGVPADAEGAVTCIVTYTDQDGKERTTTPFSISYTNRKGQQTVSLPDTYRGNSNVTIRKIKIENSWCTARN